ncbi:MAG: peptidase M1 [Balneolaceae bacterium]|nr:peptidase M1 [Balneolaceae bacterium]
MLSLIVGYYRFNFNVVTGKAGKKASTTNQSKASTTGASISIPSPAIRFDLQTAIRQLASHSWFHIRTILKESSFWAIAACAVATIFINSISLDIKYGVDSYPATYLIVSQLIELSVLFFLFIILFYSGELVWKERDANFHQVFDTVPVSSFISLTGKLLALLVILAFLLLSMMAAGMVFQAFNEYYIFEPGLYFMEFFTGIFFFLVLLSLVAFFFQSVLNNKYVAHIAMAVFLVVGIVVLNLSGYSHPLYSFGGGFLPMYSEMNSYGSFLKGYLWIKSYWLWFSIMLFASATLFIARGTETDFKQRWKSRRQRYTKPLGRLIAGAFLFFVFSGGYIFYNTNILSDFDFPSAEKVYKANYEKALKKFEHLPQPKITAVNLNVDLYPSERNFIAKGSFTLVNKHDQAIPEIHIQKAPSPDLTIERIEFERASEADNTYEEYGYFIHTLDTPLQPGDSLKMEFRQTYITQGLETGLNHDIVQNGTFFNNNYFPTLGYHPDIELEDKSEREEQGLKPRARRASINDPIALKQGMANDDGEEIRFEIVVSTDSSQTAIAPGYLESHWTEGDRSYFRYRTNQPITNFYSVTSADYKVVKDRWTPSANHSQDPVELEIYYQKGHEYNLKRMMKGLKKSLGYFNSHFSPYQYPQLRIMEFPRYRTFAQSFASTIPFSEAIGFMMDIDDEKDVDMAFAITAHEVAHQWWGHQVNPANVQGRSMISESLAQYSALMVLKKEFSDEKAHQFVQREMRRYLRGRSDEEQQEMPLALVESGQDYIHYGKGAVNMYALQDYISEDSVNLALKRFLRDWNNIDGLIKLRTDRYATTNDLIGYFREVTPDSLQYVLEDLFETITLHDIQAVSGSYESTASQQFEVNLEVDVTKLRLNKSGIEDTVEVHDWIDIGVYAEDKNGSQELIYLKKHKITEPLTNIEITVDRRPTKAGIDPLHKLIDREPDDNVIGLSGKEEGRESP